MKKIVKSLLLAILTFIIIFSLFPAAVFADNSVFEPRLSAPSRDTSFYNKSLNVFSQTGYGMPNCTAYAYGRIYEITGKEPLIKRGDAGRWWSINKSNGYYEYGQEPKLGAIACWSNHVAVVEEIDGNTVTVSQSHWRGTYFDTCTFTSGDSHFGQKFYGYIYASDIIFEKAQEEENKTSYKKEKPVYETADSNTSTLFEIGNIELLNANKPVGILVNSHMLANAVN